MNTKPMDGTYDTGIHTFGATKEGDWSKGGAVYDAMIELAETIARNFPWGSGIDAGGGIHVTDTKIEVESEYHMMNEAGFYVGWLPFRFTLEWDGENAPTATDFFRTAELDFYDAVGEETAEEGMHGDYLGDLFSYGWDED